MHIFCGRVIIFLRFFKNCEDISLLWFHLSKENKKMLKDVLIHSEKVIKLKNSIFNIDIKMFDLCTKDIQILEFYFFGFLLKIIK